MSSRIAIIPARGGSKRLPRKNILDFNGKPLICWSIDVAKKCGLFDSVVVSTEDNEIGEIAERNGASWHKREQNLATDTASVVDVCLDVLNSMKWSAHSRFETMVCLYATSPLRTENDIVSSVSTLENEKLDSVITVTDYYYSPFEALHVKDDGSASLMWPDYVAKTRFELPRAKVDAGSVYAVSVESFLTNADFYAGKLKVIELPRQRAVDIDDQDGYDLALYYSKKYNTES